ncbi:MAG: CDP-alcohol phosphatidyltransferase family protein [Holophagaceae bacterium]|nr:CDP-alcohol phosphatidyltransferase family protein [Holophagaceae bacterium]
MNLPNLLSLARILMVPVMVVVLMTKVTNHEVIGVMVFWVASITDALDGYLARRWKQVTTLGKLLDPGRQAPGGRCPDLPGGVEPGAGLDDLHHPLPGIRDHRAAGHRQRGRAHHPRRHHRQVEDGFPGGGHLLPDPRSTPRLLAL